MNSEEEIFRLLAYYGKYDLINRHNWNKIENLLTIFNFSNTIILPNTLKVLSITNVDNEFNNNIKLPNSLIKLDLGQFNYPINLIKFPNSLKVLKFGDWFNQPITGILPPNLEFLSFGTNFVKTFGYLELPDSLKVIQLKGYNYYKFPKCKILILEDININIKNEFDTKDTDRIHLDTEILCFNNIQYPLLTLPLNIKKIYLPQHDELKKIMENSKIPFGCEIIYVKSDSNNINNTNNTSSNKNLFKEIFGKDSQEIELYL